MPSINRCKPTQTKTDGNELMTQEEPTVQAAYLVKLFADGSLQTVPMTEGVERIATAFDVFRSTSEINKDLETQLIADKVARLVVANLTPKTAAEETKEKIVEALNDRGIETPSV